MEKLFFGMLIVILLLAIPYFYKIYSLKKITEEDLPDSGSWVNLSRGNIYFQWHTPEVSEPLKGTIVLVHGFSTPSFVWGGLLDNFLNAGYKVLVYDHYGRGYSERPNFQYDKELYLETLRELIVSQDIQESVHLVGYSMGGPIVGLYADQYPESTKSTTLIAPAGFSTSIPNMKSWTTMPLIGDWFWRVFSDRLYGIGNMSETQSSSDPLSINENQFLPLFQKQLQFRGFNESLLSTIRHFNLYDVREMYLSLSNKKIPILALWGKKDGVVPYSGSKEYKSIFSEGNFISLEEGTHDITYRQPTIVGKEIIKFIDSV
ncbi:MAG: alpha/beta hydrolase [SAR86 cluster bacterium]|nr:alpha/beta hydrolase [SAR86 cluster bacterium]